MATLHDDGGVTFSAAEMALLTEEGRPKTVAPPQSRMDPVGRWVRALRPMTRAELAREGWHPRKWEIPLCLELDNGVILYASQDGEGNGPGVLFGGDDLTKNTVAYGGHE